MTHWNSPQFHAFYPTGNSYPAIVGEIISTGISCIGLSWIASPACTELEVITTNWLGKLIGLPKEFLHSTDGYGGGVIQVKLILNYMERELIQQFNFHYAMINTVR